MLATATSERAVQRVMLMRLAQSALMPDPCCLDAPPAGMMQLCHRESVVQFVKEVCEDFQLTSATAGLAVSYFDRFVSAVSSPEGRGLEKQRVQLLAVTCTRLAAKFAEVKMPSLDDMVEIAQGLFNKTQLKEMELEALRVLQWELSAVTPHAALEQLVIAIALRQPGHADAPLEHAAFFVDLSCYVYELLPFPPLVIASSALLCAWSHLGELKAVERHMVQLCALCGVSMDDLFRCKTILQQYFDTTFPEAAAAAEMHRASICPARSESPGSVMDKMCI